jgi:hypothetical protein
VGFLSNQGICKIFLFTKGAPFVKLVMSSSILSYNELMITNSGFEQCEVCCWGLELGVVVGDSRAVKV